jgi:hypothetical protein
MNEQPKWTEEDPFQDDTDPNFYDDEFPDDEEA